MIENQMQLKTVGRSTGRSTGHAQNMHRKKGGATIDRPVDRTEEATAVDPN